MPKSRIPRALVVEDEPAWQQIVSEILQDCGLEVDVAGNLEEAVFLLRQAPHRLAVVDLSLGDEMAANQDGLRVLESVELQDPGCTTLLLTGYATVELAVSVLTDYGAMSCLQKATFDRAEFRGLVRRALSVPPVYEEAQERAAPRSALPRRSGSDHDVPSASTAVLVVEDDAGWRGILAELLSEAGYRVRLCNSYGEAVGCLRREPYALAIVDLSLTDVPRPDADDSQDLGGYQLLALAGEEGVATIVVSGVANLSDIERAYNEFGVYSYLEKQSFDRRAFLQTVAEARETSASTREVEGLTSRELEVLALIAQGMTNRGIAEALVISTNTVKRHLKSVFDKLGVHTRAAAAAKAISVGIPPDASSYEGVN